jgi:Putative translation initiation inhibitor, yjgF family
MNFAYHMDRKRLVLIQQEESKEPSARVCIQAAKLPKDALMEIDLIAAY